MSNDQEDADLPTLKSRRFYQQALDNMPTQLAIFDAQGKYLYVTPSAVSDPKVRAWLVGRDDFDYCELRGLDRSIAQQRHDTIMGVVSNKKTLQFEESLQIGDQAPRHIVRFLSPVFDENGEVVQVLGYGLDITVRLNAEKALALREEQYRSLVEGASDLIYQADEAGNFTYANPVVYQILGYSEGQILGHHFANLISEDYRRQVIDHYSHLVEEKRESDYFEFPVETSNGEVLWLGQHVLMIWDGDDFNGISAVARDITERVRAELAQKESEALKTAMLATALDCVITIDEHSKIIEFNPAAARTFGYDSDYALGRDLADLIIPDHLRSAHKAGMEHYLKTGEGPVLGQRIEITALRSDGSEFPVELAITAIESGPRKLFTAYIRDITTRKEVEKALIDGKKAAEQSARAKEIFLASMSHEIRTPLNAIVGMVHLLQDTTLSSKQRQYLDATQFSVDSLLGLVDEVLDLTKIEAGVIEPQLKVFSIHETMSDLIEVLRPKANEKGLKLTLSLADDLPEGLRGDPLRTSQIVTNLVTNAIKYSDTGEIRTQILLDRIDSESATLTFRVSDQGRGIADNQLDDVFEHFTQVDNSTGAKNPGVGLGLPIVKKLTEILGGQVTATSELGKGSQFTVNLPFILAELEPDDKTSAIEYSTQVIGARILVVEDNPMNQLLMNELLSKWGADVTLAENGQVAVEMVSTHEFDLILMDIQMPVLNGYEATRQIRKNVTLSKDALPIIALTASAVIEQRNKALEAGMNAFVTKPFVPAQLRKEIEAHLATRKHALEGNHDVDSVSQIDRAVLTEQTLGNAKLAVTVINLFLTQLDDNLREIEAALVEPDFESIRFTSHKLKSSSASVGATGFAAVFAELETMAGEGQIEPVRICLDRLKSAFPQVRSELLEIREDLDSE